MKCQTQFHDQVSLASLSPGQCAFIEVEPLRQMNTCSMSNIFLNSEPLRLETPIFQINNSLTRSHVPRNSKKQLQEQK